MKISDHELSKVCKKIDLKKYDGLLSESKGYQKLCCYVVKLLDDNSIITSYENICVALWKMFPEADRFHLYGFDDMPDTDFMEKLVKLRGVHTHEVIMGGNVHGKTTKYGFPYHLTARGLDWAEETEEMLTGTAKSAGKQKMRDTGTVNKSSYFKKIIQSDLFQRFTSREAYDGTRNTDIAAALDMYYSSDSFTIDLKEKINEISKDATALEKEGFEETVLKQVSEFLEWIKTRGIKNAA